jgi:Ca2+:H+ antiporter
MTAKKFDKYFYWLLVFIPVSILLNYLTDLHTLSFFTVVLSLIGLARLLGRSTENHAAYSTPKVSGILNATFGNFIELSISVFALKAGLIDLVRGSIVGSVMVNILLVIGLSIFIGGLKYKEQKFNIISAGISGTMLIIATIGLAMPSLYQYTTGRDPHILSTLVSVVLALIYLSGLLFSLYTHKYLFYTEDTILSKLEGVWPKERSVLVLMAASALVAFQSNLLVDNVTTVTQQLGLSNVFIGIVVVGILSNVAEMIAAITMALKNKINISLEIGASSANQIALFVVPILVFVSAFFIHRFSLVFTLFELAALMSTVLILNYLVTDGRGNWLEGVQLVAVYIIIAIAFYFV